MNDLISAGREALRPFLRSQGQLRVPIRGQDGAGYIEEGWCDSGCPFDCCLYTPKSAEIPAPLALLDRTVYWLAGDFPDTAKAKDVVKVDGVTYEIHAVPNERTNEYFPRMLVSRLK